ncbi:hypothetical protein R1sor_002747 [Riccia sorocarpa]|uniref:Uncharacterized protein n=1 Tax=Riccia sorocarpa TaxID=122646 RepID=A0ABD3H2U0_9MARC
MAALKEINNLISAQTREVPPIFAMLRLSLQTSSGQDENAEVYNVNLASPDRSTPTIWTYEDSQTPVNPHPGAAQITHQPEATQNYIETLAQLLTEIEIETQRRVSPPNLGATQEGQSRAEIHQDTERSTDTGRRMQAEGKGPGAVDSVESKILLLASQAGSALGLETLDSTLEESDGVFVSTCAALYLLYQYN